jgi:hypothetical protein
MIRWLLSWLFPVWTLLPRARALGSVTFQTVDGVGWMCTIRPPLSQRPRRGAINAWHGGGKTMGAALRAALGEVEAKPSESFEGAAFAPRLGGKEFDDE